MKCLKRFFLVGAAICGVIPFAGAQGALLWQRIFDDANHRDDVGNCVAIDSQNNVIIAGGAEGGGHGDDFYLIKYNPQGTKLWEHRVSGNGTGTDEILALGVDASNNVYVTGPTFSSASGYDYLTIKYSPSGSQLWSKRYNGPGNGFDVPYALAVGKDGSVTVSGTSLGRAATGYDWATLRYDSNGNQLWVRRFAGAGANDDELYGLALNSSDEPVIVGSSASSGGSTGFDFGVLQYDTAGNQMWFKTYRAPGPGFGGAYAVAVDKNDNVVLTGTAEYSSTGFDAVTIKYDPAGHQQWLKRLALTGDGGGVAIGTDANGNVFVGGYDSGTGNGYNYLILKYDPNGTRLWGWTFNYGAYRDDLLRALAVDRSGNVAITGIASTAIGYQCGTIKLDPDGNKLWSRVAGEEGRSITTDGTGRVYVGGYTYTTNTLFDFMTLKYSP